LIMRLRRKSLWIAVNCSMPVAVIHTVTE
jgi:hypothetical protein